MSLPRSSQICLSECTCYHVISRCNRQLHLLGGDPDARADRKGLLLKQLERLATHTAVGVAGFSIMDNHVHLLLKVDAESARKWSAREVARRWLALHPPRDGYFKPVEVGDEHLAVLASDADAIAAAREKLMSISQFMKELKQEVTQRINRLDDTVGSVWAGRFKSKRVTDEAQLLTTLAYIDLNPFAAGVCKTPEQGEHTSLAARLFGGASQADGVEATLKTSVRKKNKQSGQVRERRGWWMTVGGGQPGMAGRARSLMPDTDLTFGRYLKLLDAVSRLMRKGKNRMQDDARTISQRLGVSPLNVAATLTSWFEEGLPWDRARVASG